MSAKSRLGVFLREALVFLVFCALTALVTWPYVKYLRDVVLDEGDPYLVSWIMWWDYHQTFTDPLNLFHSNIFYPYPYSLAFSEHMYGVSLLFFPLFAVGVRPLTVHAVAMFVGFALCGYGAFRLARTLTGSNTAAWVAGIAFAFAPFRLDQMSQLPYLFTVWIPLSLEALILFVRQTSWKRAVWLGVAIVMLGLSSMSWLILSFIPMMFATIVLLTRYHRWRERDFWSRGLSVLVVAAMALLPFFIPYSIVARTYGFTRTIQEVKDNSALPIHWLSFHPRSKLWMRIGPTITPNARFGLFPGLLPLVFSAAALVLRSKDRKLTADSSSADKQSTFSLKWVFWLDRLIGLSLFASVFAIYAEGTDSFGGLFNYVKSEFIFTALTIAIVARCSLAYPNFLRGPNANLVETVRAWRDDALWLGIFLTALGFFYSLGWNFFFYRICYDVIPLFRAMRMPTRGAMYACLGLAILSGVGVKRITDLLSRSRLHWSRRPIAIAISALLLFELNAAPLAIIRGDVSADAVSLRLRETPMRGGIVMLPVGGGFNHHHVLRAADHGRPLITATSGFTPPFELEIENLTNSGPITAEFLDLLEKIPASYVVVLTHLVRPERKAIYENFFSRAVAGGRLRFVNRFDEHDDLYAVVKTEPQARNEAPLPFAIPQREWSTTLEEEPLHLLSHSLEWTRAVYCMYLAAFGRMPRYHEFIEDMKELGKGVVMGSAEAEPQLQERLLRLAQSFQQRDEFKARYDKVSGEEFVQQLLTNAGLQITEVDRAALAVAMQNGSEDHASVLVKLGTDPRVLLREQNRALVLVYFFAYLQRNPDDPPDRNLDGFLHWVGFLEHHGAADLTTAFASSIEHAKLLERKQQR
ncbi:MAG: hypothetical protein ACR2H4_17970 [Pyrinomonadaceae bacterium]